MVQKQLSFRVVPLLFTYAVCNGKGQGSALEAGFIAKAAVREKFKEAVLCLKITECSKQPMPEESLL